MVLEAKNDQPTKVRKKKAPSIAEEEERILKRAQMYLLYEAQRPMLWTVADIREEKGDDGSRRWIIAVHLRYPTGHEGYLGDLVFDGERVTELTDLELMRQRGREIAADPALQREWEAYLAANPSPGNAEKRRDRLSSDGSLPRELPSCRRKLLNKLANS